ncbi:uncharacterized protein LOC116947170 isoform X2 [Petromyzon marinus]|uniref:uncharacterized protein LOC116947170 isoform X2 n=1 Tax=Petromyzon marinus TaxID=7757 RepID=UPI003F6FA6EB
MGISKELQRDDAKVGGKGFKKLFSLRRAKKGREKQREEQAQVEEQVEEEEGEEEESGSRGLENSAFAPRDRELGGDAGQPGWQAVWADGFHGQGTPGGARARLGNIAALPDRTWAGPCGVAGPTSSRASPRPPISTSLRGRPPPS